MQMVNRVSLFITTVLYNVLRFVPHRRDEIGAYLAELSEGIAAEPGCADILEIWLDNFGLGGQLLGSVALFACGFLLMCLADAAIRHAGNGALASVIDIVSGIYCIDKFRGAPWRTPRNMLILLYVALALLAGFEWTITLLFLAIFINIEVASRKGSGVL